YNDWRAFCGFDRVETRSDFVEVVGNAALVEKIMDVRVAGRPAGASGVRRQDRPAVCMLDRKTDEDAKR
ncbi:hypothetical protein M9458_034100, partial [Cirrhinus mrigala]